MRRATLAGVETIEHGDDGSSEVFRLMKEQGVALCPTLSVGNQARKKETFPAALAAGVQQGGLAVRFQTQVDVVHEAKQPGPPGSVDAVLLRIDRLDLPARQVADRLLHLDHGPGRFHVQEQGVQVAARIVGIGPVAYQPAQHAEILLRPPRRARTGVGSGRLARRLQQVDGEAGQPVLTGVVATGNVRQRR